MLDKATFRSFDAILVEPGPREAAHAAELAAFDRMAITSILEKALAEREQKGGRLADRLGISGTALGILLMLNIPDHPVLAPDDYVQTDMCEEQGWVRDLLARNANEDLEISQWIAAMIARRAMEANHLWEDLGLPDRESLSRLLNRHFAPLASQNTNNMRWKRFFFRMLCEEEGLNHCSSPSCADCADVERCFEPDSALYQIARSKRT